VAAALERDGTAKKRYGEKRCEYKTHLRAPYEPVKQARVPVTFNDRRTFPLAAHGRTQGFRSFRGFRPAKWVSGGSRLGGAGFERDSSGIRARGTSSQ